jgi:hypothetical protein
MRNVWVGNRLLLLRSSATLLEVATLVGVGLAIAWVAVRRNMLYAWDGEQFGYWILAAILFGVNILPKQPIFYRLVGLRLATLAGTAPSCWHRASRETFFWLCVGSPGLLRVDELVAHLPMSSRERLIGSIAVTYSLVLLPITSTVFSRGTFSVGDWLAGTTVSPFDASRGSSATTFRSRIVVRAFAGITSVLVLGMLLIDAKYRISDELPNVLKANAESFAKLDKSGAGDSRHFMDIVQRSASADSYFNQDGTAHLAGEAEYLRIRVSPDVLNSERKVMLAAIDAALVFIPIVSPTAMWLEVTMYADRRFGPFWLERNLKVLLNAREPQVRYAPTGQVYVVGSDSLTLSEYLTDSMPAKAVITKFKRKEGGSIAFMLGGWQFRRLEFFAPPAIGSGKFPGQY